MSEPENMSLQEEFQQDLENSENPLNTDSEEVVEENIADPSKEQKPKKEFKSAHSVQLENFQKAFQEQPELDQRLQMAVDFMESSLGQGVSPHFKNFWEARKLCLPLFKENVSSVLKAPLWNKFSDLSKEARRLKEVLDEQSAFAVEQIEIAISALEIDISQFEEQAAKASSTDSIYFPKILDKRKEFYLQIQNQLNILNAQASRINALRKELLKTEMRIRQKNKFFQRLSTTGDSVFPKRKDLIKNISQQFVEDVEQFIKFYFSDEKYRDALYTLREEIKSLQGLAKVLTLNTNSFTQTRMRLSECWDKIKVEEKDRKKERSQQRVVFKENADAIQAQINTLKSIVEAGEEGNTNDWQKKLNELSDLIRNTELGRDEVKTLRDELHEVRKLLQDKSKTEEQARHQLEEEKKKQKRAKYEAIKDQIEQLLKAYRQFDAEKLVSDREQLLAQINESSLSKGEKLELERILKPLRDLITEKREQALMNLSEDDRQSLTQLQEVLKQRKERRQEVKEQLEMLRKAAGSSSLDFEKAMQYTMQVNEDKDRLDKINQGIEEVEEKIVELKSKLTSK